MARTVRFDCFEVDLDSGQLLKRGLRIKLRDQSFHVLALLLEQPGQVVSREELQRRLWRDEVFVDFDNNLNIIIARLRQALGDSAEHPRYIETLPKRGYRFLAPISEAPVSRPARARRARLLVLPFVNLSGEPADEPFTDAITGEIITALADVAPEQLAVIARTTAMRYKGSHKDVARIGRELAVDYVLEGGVRCNDERTAVNFQLIQVSDQTQLVARKYETLRHDLVSIPSRAACDVAAQLGIAPVPEGLAAAQSAGATAGPTRGEAAPAARQLAPKRPRAGRA